MYMWSECRQARSVLRAAAVGHILTLDLDGSRLNDAATSVDPRGLGDFSPWGKLTILMDANKIMLQK